MRISVIYRGEPGTEPGRRASRLPASRLLSLLAGAGGVILLASACGTGPAHQASAAGAPARPAAGVGVPARVVPASVAGRSSPGPAATQPAPPVSPPATGITVAQYTGPHFSTPRAAMTFLADAYNSGDTTALHALTDSQAFNALQTMRSTYHDLRLTSCTPRKQGDYVCSFRYDPSGHHSTAARATTMFIAAPAVNPGWYLYQFLEGCD
jgi:hypothetical protein